MTEPIRHVDFPGRLVFIGFGSIGQAVLPLILRHTGVTGERVTIVTAAESGRAEAEGFGARFLNHPLVPENYRAVLDPLIGPGDFLLNLSVDVSSLDLIRFARAKGALYLDTCIEPWTGGYTDPDQPPEARSNYAFREAALALRTPGPGPTAVLTHGANPGLVSHFVKQALLDVAAATGLDRPAPAARAGWAELARDLGVRAIHIAERDTQYADVPKRRGEFVNTWSVSGFTGEGAQPAELGWGTHERGLPAGARRHATGCRAAIYLTQPGAATRVRSWTPLEGPYIGWLITHNEAISLADFLTVGQGDTPEYRPTVHYAYHPCNDAVLSLHELAGRNWRVQESARILMDEIVDGIDELGVLLLGHARTAYWYGSQLSVGEARRLAPHNNATSLQVAAAVLGGMVWAIENPQAGIVEPEDLDFRRVLEIARPYLGPVVGVYSGWTPLADRGRLFPEAVDATDPWQFANIRVTG